MVVEHGGSFSMNLNKSVTHCIASESRGFSLFPSLSLPGARSWKSSSEYPWAVGVHYNINLEVTLGIILITGIKFQAAKLHGDVIQCSWIFDCCLQKKLLPLQPKWVTSQSFSSCSSLPVVGVPCVLWFFWLCFLGFLLKVFSFPFWFNKEKNGSRSGWIFWFFLLWPQHWRNWTGIIIC